MSNYDDDIGDMEGFENQHANDDSDLGPDYKGRYAGLRQMFASRKTAGEKVTNEDGSVTVDGKTYQPGSAMYQALMGDSGPVTKGARRRIAGDNDRPAGAAPQVDQVTDNPEDDTDMFGGMWSYDKDADNTDLKVELAKDASLNEDFDMFAPAVEKTAMPAPADVGVSVGDVFYCSWGYDQTNVNFYEVIRLTGQGVEVQPIWGKVISSGSGSEKVVPDIGNAKDWDVLTGVGVNDNTHKSKVCRLRDGYNGRPRIILGRDYSAGKWEGTPLHQTDAYSGH
jgi:hypothetical protein